MTARLRGALALMAFAVPVALSPVGSAFAAARTSPAPTPQALYLPADLANICEADSQALQQAITRHWRPSLTSIDQWTQLVRSFSCDLSGSRDLGWHRVPLRAYESAIRYPLQWVDWEDNAGRSRRTVRTYYSAAHLPPKIDFWVGGRIDEIRYDRRSHRIDARFPAAGTRGASRSEEHTSELQSH